MTRVISNLRRLMVILLGIFLLVSWAGAEVVWGDLNARYANIPQIEYNNMRYRLKSRLTTILLAGTDRDSKVSDEQITLRYRNGGQADFLLMLAIDDAQRTITPLQIDRDTVTEITVVNVTGQVSGTRQAQICLAHSFGDGGNTSCDHLIAAVEHFLKGTPVHHSMILDMEGIALLNDALGGVQVTLQDDFSALDPEMTAGKTMVLNGQQAEIFLRGRFGMADGTNAARQIRQQTYMSAAKDVFLTRVGQDSRFINELMDALEPYLRTDMGNARLVNYARSAKNYEILPVQTLLGEYRVDERGFVEFIPDETALMDLVISTFYVPMN